ncbi:MBG domain-containing protein, partial [Chitinophaga sp. RAB17]|uniref:MBG domain-containing protein n=1 Tax=Chitinophaga sp. RAB17 TaxID=3233049 RepID=UPI003F929D0B
NGTLTVDQAAQTISFPAISGKTYGDAPVTLNASSNAGLPVTYTVTSGPATISGNILTITGAGSVTVTATQAGNGNYTAATPASITFQVAPAILTLKIDDQQIVSGGVIPAFTYTITGYVNNDNSHVVRGSISFNTTAPNNTQTGTYPIKVLSTTLIADNYTLTTINGTLTIGQQAQTISFPAITGKTYGDAAFALSASSNSGLATTYSVVSGPATINGNMVTITGSGSITIAADQAGNANYKPATTATQTFVVSKATLIVKADDAQRIYGAGNPTFTYRITGFVNNENAGVINGIPTLGSIADNNSIPGTYPINVVATGMTATNYLFTTVNGTLTIGKATQTINFPAITGKTYGDAPTTLNASSDANLTVTYAVTSGPATISGNILTITGAGSVTVTATQTGNGNYTAATPVSNTFQVTPATLTVKADNTQRIYGINNPAFTFTITGFVNNENASVVTGIPTLSSIADNNSVPGAYPITVSTSALVAANYIFTSINGTLTVGPATQTISFPAISNKTYGDAAFTAGASSNSSLTVVYSVVSGPANVNGNTITITGAGNVTIAANQAGNGSYSAAAEVTQTFLVNKAALTVKASNDTRTYSGTAYTGGNGIAYTGFVNGDDATKLIGSITYAGSAQGAINAGTYVITPAGVSSNNYDITYTDGQLTIAKATQQIVFTAPGDKNQGDPDFTLVATASSGLPVTFTSDNTAAISINGNTAKVGTAGTAHISASQAGDNNYEPAQTATQTVVVTAWATPVITALGSTAFCDGNTVTLQSSTAPAYEWYRNNVLISAAGSQTLTAKESGSYMVKAIYDNNVRVSSAAVSITVHPLPAGSIRTQGNTTISKGETVTLIASGGNNYAWDPAAGLNDPRTATPVARPEVTTTYHVTITNNDGCSVTEEITINVKEDYKLEATNILTPNGDGKNDLWVVKNIDMYPQNEVKIFDRAGRMVFHQRGYTNNWNGTVNGQRLAEGTYYYIIDLGNNKPQFKGFITLINSNY